MEGLVVVFQMQNLLVGRDPLLELPKRSRLLGNLQESDQRVLKGGQL